MKLLLLLTLAGIAAALCLQHPCEIEEDADPTEEVALRLERAMALFERGRLTEAKAVFLSQRMEFTRMLGPHAPATLKVRNNLATVMFAMGDYNGAEAVQRSVLALREETLGRLHEDSLASRHNLAVTLLSEKKYEEALMNARLVESGRLHMLGRKSVPRKESGRLRECIQNSLEDSRRENEVPRGGPSGLNDSSVGTA